MTMVHALRPVRTVAPVETPVSLSEAKAHLRVDHTDEDTLITGLVAAATDHLDGHSGTLGRGMVTQTWLQRFDTWAGTLHLPFPDVSSVTVTYLDSDDAEQTVAGGNYTLLENASGAFIRFSDTFTAPTIGPDEAGVSVSMVCGYGDASAVPAALKAAILLHVGTLYEHRETLSGKVTPNMAYEALVAPYRRVGV